MGSQIHDPFIPCCASTLAESARPARTLPHCIDQSDHVAKIFSFFFARFYPLNSPYISEGDFS